MKLNSIRIPLAVGAASLLVSGALEASPTETPLDSPGIASTPFALDGALSAPEAPLDPTRGWFRIDTDSSDTFLQVGATHSFRLFSLTSDLVLSRSSAQVDLGPYIEVGPLSLTPMVGIGFDFGTSNLSNLDPQLYTNVELGAVAVSSWWTASWTSPFLADPELSLYTRNFALWSVSDSVAFGPQAEATYMVRSPVEGESGVTSSPFGGRINLSYGEKNTIGIFLGYEPTAPARSDRIAGRFTFVRSW